jgi:phospholipase/lecithinase/hemolysin
MPPLAAIPLFLTGPQKNAPQNIKTALADACVAFKNDEDAAIPELEKNNAGLMIMEVDVLGLFTKVRNNPGAYGFVNVDDKAMGKPANTDPSTYVFWDDIHPTTRADQLIANEALNVLILNGKVVPEPSAMILMLAGALPLAVRVRARFRRPR